MNPLISIIVPIYNSEKYINECIKSLQKQSYTNLEIILINDGSTDRSLEICHEFAKNDERIKIINQANFGVSSARNRGILLSSGDYIGFVDSDDVIEGEMFENLVKRIEYEKGDICAMISYSIKPIQNRLKTKETINSSEAIKQLLLLRFPTSLWAYFYKANIVKKNILNTDIHFFEDFEMNFRILCSVDKILLVKEELYKYRSHDYNTNKQSLNHKRMDILNIYEIHKNKIIQLGHNYNKYSLYFRSHFIISIIISASKSINISNYYILKTRERISEMFKQIVLSKVIPIDYKIIMIVFYFSPKSCFNILKLYRKLLNHEN